MSPPINLTKPYANILFCFFYWSAGRSGGLVVLPSNAINVYIYVLEFDSHHDEI